MCSSKALCGKTETPQGKKRKKKKKEKTAFKASKSVFKAKKTKSHLQGGELKLKSWGNLKCQYRHH